MTARAQESEKSEQKAKKGNALLWGGVGGNNAFGRWWRSLLVAEQEKEAGESVLLRLTPILGETMSSNNINDLLGADLDEEIDEILDDDDMDAILGSPSGSSNTAELDGILGGIGDEYLTDDEKVFLQNKNFIANTPPGQLDAHFLQMQEEVYSELENTLEDFSLGSVSDDDEFGEDPDDDEFDSLELESG